MQCDADVAGQRFEQLDIFAREEVAAERAAEADDGDGAAVGRAVQRFVDGLRLRNAARQIVVQVEQGGGALLIGGRCTACWAFSRKMWV